MILFINPYILGSIDPGFLFLQSSAKIFYDFTKLTGTDGSAITSVADLSPNGINASNESPAQSPKLKKIQYGDSLVNTFKGYPTTGSKDVLIANTTGDGQFKSDFEIVFIATINLAADSHYFGTIKGTDFIVAYISSNKLVFNYSYSTSAKNFLATSNNAIYSLSQSGFYLINIKCDFTNHIFKMYCNGVDLAYTVTGSAFSTLVPSNWNNNTYKLAVGGANNNGAIVAHTGYNCMSAFAVTPIMTDRQRIDVYYYLLNSMTKS